MYTTHKCRKCMSQNTSASARFGRYINIKTFLLQEKENKLSLSPYERVRKDVYRADGKGLHDKHLFVFMKKWSVDDRPKLQSTAIHAYSEIENEHHIKSLTASSGGGNSKANMNCSIIKCNKYIHMIAFIDKLAMDYCRMSLLTLCYSRIVPFSRAHAFKPPY